MTSGTKLNDALQMILNNLSENNGNEDETKTIEAENARLRQRKIELMVKLNRNFTVKSCIALVEDMLSREQFLNQIKSESKEEAATRLKEQTHEVTELTASWKENLQEVDKLITLPYNDVSEKILEMERQIDVNRSKISELSDESVKLRQDLKNDFEDVLRLSEILKSVEDDQRKLLQKLREQKTETEEDNKQGCEKL